MSTRRRVLPGSMVSSNLLLLVLAVFFSNFGEGLFQGANTNYFVDTLRLTGGQVLWLQGIREIPGLVLVLIAALTTRIAPARRAALSVLLMGLGYGLYAVVQSYAALVAVAVAASLGFHMWAPLQSSLGMGLAAKEHSGRVMGLLSSSRSAAIIVSMGGLALASRFAGGISLRVYYAIGGAGIVVAALLLARLPKDTGASHVVEQRLLIKRRYWLYYVMVLFEGVRTQVFAAFGTLILVQYYRLEVWQVSLVLLASGLVNLVASPWVGKALDRYGERWTLTIAYTLLALCYVGYALWHNVWAMSAMVILINLLALFSMGLSTYVNRIAPKEELTPTLAAGVSFNHVTSVGMSFVAGSLLGVVGYESLALGAAVIILVSVPFALAMRVEPLHAHQAEPVAAS
ncbi:MAG: MFS transporter [Chloroflexi bacterium]|nr:MFS transporter [Chloroflexota bacterium]